VVDWTEEPSDAVRQLRGEIEEVSEWPCSADKVDLVSARGLVLVMGGHKGSQRYMDIGQ
jgi:hypothetical protein